MRLAMKVPLAAFIVLTAVALTRLSGLPEKRDLNKTSRPQLEQIPGIGPSLASRIVLERSRRGGFRSMDDLLKIRGISRKTLTQLNSYFYIGYFDDFDEQEIRSSDCPFFKPSDLLKETCYD